MDALKKRQIELDRQTQVTSIESTCLQIKPGESRCFEIIDLETLARVRMRFSRLKADTGRAYSAEMEGNSITVTRTA